MPQNRLRDLTVPEPPKLVASVDQMEQGRTLFHEYCAVCHGFGVASSLVLPDLRYMRSEKHGAFLDIVRGGILAPRGMPGFRDFLSEEEAGLVQQYIASQARALFDEQKQSES
jgi:quinohemoprotein ethanol dehydrogenase